MVGPILGSFGLAADRDLRIGRAGQTLTDITVRALAGVDGLLRQLHPDVVVVQGDTSTSFAGALAAFYHRIPVAHVEAGLRTGQRYSPFPEELNRRMTGALATLHLAPTPGNVGNLLNEGVHRDSIVCTGNTVVDALQLIVAQNPVPSDEGLAELIAAGTPVVLVTVHRRESWGEPLAAVAAAVAEVARRFPDVVVVVPAHPNPTVRDTLRPARDVSNVRIVEPLEYRSFAAVLARSVLVLTDSGGIQEEAPSLGVPVLVLRDVTERPEALRSGAIELVGTDPDRIVRRASELLAGIDLTESARSFAEGSVNATRPNPYGDGSASARTVTALAHLLGDGPPAEEFVPPW
jgi:UDP-N-acetylglucosamine 2-epimerase (non-hydrolysing)